MRGSPRMAMWGKVWRGIQKDLVTMQRWSNFALWAWSLAGVLRSPWVLAVRMICALRVATRERSDCVKDPQVDVLHPSH